MVHAHSRPRRGSRCSAISVDAHTRARVLRGERDDAARRAPAPDQLRLVAREREDSLRDRNSGHQLLHSPSGSHHGYAAGRSSGTRIENSGGRRSRNAATPSRGVGCSRHGEQQRGVDAMRLRGRANRRHSPHELTRQREPTPARCRARDRGRTQLPRRRTSSATARTRPAAIASSAVTRPPDISQSSAVGTPTRRGQEPRRARFGDDPQPGEHEPERGGGDARRASIASVIDAPDPDRPGRSPPR